MKKLVNWKRLAGDVLTKQKSAEEKIKQLLEQLEKLEDEVTESYTRFLRLSEDYSKNKANFKRAEIKFENEITELRTLLNLKLDKVERQRKFINEQNKEKSFLKKRVEELIEQLDIITEKHEKLGRFRKSKLHKIIIWIQELFVKIKHRIKKWRKK